MARTESVVVSYKGSLTPKKTSFLAPEPIGMEFSASIDLEDSDIPNAKNVQKEFQAAMKRQLETQLNALNTWLTETDRMLANLVDEGEKLKKVFPKTLQQVEEKLKKYRDLRPRAEMANQLPELWKQMVTDWATNAREQQGRVAMTLAVKAARIKTFSDKTWRVRSAQALKVGLAVAGVVLSVAAVIMTSGAATPLALGVASATTSLSGLASLGEAGYSVYKNWNIEKKLMENLTADVQKVREAVDVATQGKGALAKHVTEMQNLIKMREDSIQVLERDLHQAEIAAKHIQSNARKLLAEGALDASAHAKFVAEVNTVAVNINETSSQINILKTDNAQSQQVLTDLQSMVGDLSNLSIQTASTLAANLKTKLTTFKGVVDVLKQMMKLGQSASKFGQALAH